MFNLITICSACERCKLNETVGLHLRNIPTFNGESPFLEFSLENNDRKTIKIKEIVNVDSKFNKHIFNIMSTKNFNLYLSDSHAFSSFKEEKRDYITRINSSVSWMQVYFKKVSDICESDQERSDVLTSVIRQLSTNKMDRFSAGDSVLYNCMIESLNCIKLYNSKNEFYYHKDFFNYLAEILGLETKFEEIVSLKNFFEELKALCGENDKSLKSYNEMLDNWNLCLKYIKEDGSRIAFTQKNF